MSKYQGSANEELESVALSGRKGGEVEAEAQTGADDVSTQGGESSQEAQTPQSWKVLDREFKSPDELAAEAERANKEILRMKQEQAEARKKAESTQSTRRQETDDDDDSGGNLDKTQIKKRLQEEYGLVDNDTVQQLIDQGVKQQITIQKVIDNVTNFVGKHDGSDGKPKAEFEKLLEVMDKHNFTDPQDAYEKLHKKELQEAMAKELMEKRPKGRVFSERSSSARTNEGNSKVSYDDRSGREARRQQILERHGY